MGFKYKRLGQGNEGTVYLVSEDTTSRQYILKVFHSPRPKTEFVGLQIYANHLSSNEYGLLPIKLWETTEEILGVYYPFVKLSTVHGRLIRFSEQVARSFVGSYCCMQYYLMSRHGIGLLEPSTTNLLLAGDGRLHLVDFGYPIAPLDHPVAKRFNLFGYGFAAFLPSLYRRDLSLVMPPHNGSQVR